MISNLRADTPRHDTADTPQRGAQAAGSEVVLAVTEHEDHVADTARHGQPVDGDHRDGHDPEALTDHQGDQGHIDDIGHIVDQVVQLREEAVQAADVAPDQAEDDAGAVLGQRQVEHMVKPVL